MIKLVQNKGKINDKIVAWVDIYYIDDYENEHPLTVRKDNKRAFNSYLRRLGFTVGIIDSLDLVTDRAITI